MAGNKSRSLRNMKIVSLIDYRQKKLKDQYNQDCLDEENFIMESIFELARDYDDEREWRNNYILNIINSDEFVDDYFFGREWNENDRLVKYLLMMMPGYNPEKLYTSNDIDLLMVEGKFPVD